MKKNFGNEKKKKRILKKIEKVQGRRKEDGYVKVGVEFYGSQCLMDDNDIVWCNIRLLCRSSRAK